MKSLKIWSLVALLAMALVGCGNDDDNGGKAPATNSNIVGKWHLASWCGETPEFDVYIEFKKDGKFDIYQQTWKFTYEHFSGAYNLEKGILSGVYSDGTDWTARYIVDVVDSKLKLINKVDLEEVSIYEESTIPNEIIEEAKSETRSEGVVPFL